MFLIVQHLLALNLGLALGYLEISALVTGKSLILTQERLLFTQITSCRQNSTLRIDVRQLSLLVKTGSLGRFPLLLFVFPSGRGTILGDSFAVTDLEIIRILVLSDL